MIVSLVSWTRGLFSSAMVEKLPMLFVEKPPFELLLLEHCPRSPTTRSDECCAWTFYQNILCSTTLYFCLAFLAFGMTSVKSSGVTFYKSKSLHSPTPHSSPKMIWIEPIHSINRSKLPDSHPFEQESISNFMKVFDIILYEIREQWNSGIQTTNLEITTQIIHRELTTTERLTTTTKRDWRLTTTGKTWLPHGPPQAFSEPFYRLPILCSGPLCNVKCIPSSDIGKITGFPYA